MKKLFAMLVLVLSASCFAFDGARIKAEWTEEDLSTHTAGGTCFAISEERLLTAYHTVDKGKIYVETEDGWMRAKIIAHDPVIDVALIETNKKHGLKVLQLGDFPPVVLSASLRGAPIVDFDGEMSEICIKVKCAPGCSGGPIVSEGKVIGMLTRVMDLKDAKELTYGIGLCVPVNTLREFLRQNKMAL